jgi:DNA/RNA-binding domain of Phe-tRNA-synthetase-like protein
VIEELDLERGWIAGELAAEFPELRIVHARVPVPAHPRSRRSPPTVKHRLRMLSDRFTGPKAIAMRQQPIPHAYRVFFRQVGIDPDSTRTPIEAIALERMRAGHFRSRNVIDDALLIATLETSVPVYAFDAANVEGGLGLRVSHPGEMLGGAEGRPLPRGQLVIADEARSLAILFSHLAEAHGVRHATEELILAGVQVKGVPDVSVEEALWTAAEIVRTPD